MRWIQRTAVFSIFVSSLARANSSGAEPSLPISDFYAPKLIMPSGVNRGKVVDSDTRRSIELLQDPAAAPFRQAPGDRVFAQFHRNGRFLIAVLPEHAIVQQTIVQLEHFPAVVPAGHMQLRFLLDPSTPLRLYEQTAPGVPPQPAGELTDFLFSAEATPVGGEPYDLVKGMNDHFLLSGRLVDTSSKYADMVTKNQHLVEQLRLNVTPAESRALLDRAISVSDEIRSKLRMYNTLQASCVSVILDDILDKVVRRPGLMAAIARFGDRVPTNAWQYIGARGLLYRDPAEQMPDFKTEMEARAKLGVPAGSVEGLLGLKAVAPARPVNANSPCFDVLKHLFSKN